MPRTVIISLVDCNGTFQAYLKACTVRTAQDMCDLWTSAIRAEQYNAIMTIEWGA